MTQDASRTTHHGSAATPLSDEQVWGEPIRWCLDCLWFVPREGADVRDWGWCIAGGSPPRGGEYMKVMPNHVACKGGFEPRDPVPVTGDPGDESRATSDEARP